MAENHLSYDSAARIVNGFDDKHILVIGDVMLDEYVWGSVDRISPEAPVPVVEARRRSFMPGGAANVAFALADLGVKVSLVGGIGGDESGKKLKTILNSKGVDTTGVFPLQGRRTTLKTRIIGHNQQIVRIDWEDSHDIEDKFVAKICRFVQKIKHTLHGIVFEDYGKGVITQNLINRVMELLQGTKIFTTFDPKRGHYLQLNGITVATPNHFEAFDAVKKKVSLINEDIERVGEELRKQWGVQAVLITLGENGMSLFEADKPVYKISTVAREVYDVSGAGDTVIASFTAALTAGATLREAAMVSNYAAGIVVGKVGTAS
ncbi:D-glycero-beta-D-manno-heptose-7-phosphate kinase, partial [bacterium]|nr:D-glycero-beta-D-manno-heptose-7-phosphate kinase [bacterium]